VLLTWVFALVFLITLVLKLDGKVQWNWFLIFLPVWVFDGILVLMLAVKMAGRCNARLRPARRLPRPAPARLVPGGRAPQAGLLPDAVRQAGEAGRREAVLRVPAAVDRVTGSAGGAGPQHFPPEERGLKPPAVPR
ncbi:unnamed protein product, partial [Tetraodon nigroviridis]